MKKPNVVIFIADTMRTSALGCYGSPFIKTPHIDAFSKDALVFRNMYQPATMCRPSRVSFFTGCYQSTHQTFFNGDTFSRKEKTLLKYLSENGYTGGYLGLFHLWNGFDRDGLNKWEWVDYWDDYVTNSDKNAVGEGSIAGFREHMNKHGLRMPKLHAQTGIASGYVDYPIEEYVPFRLNQKALACIEDFSPSSPNFLAISHWIPHEPYAPHVSNMHRYKPEDVILPENVYDKKENKPAHLSSDSLCGKFKELNGDEELKKCWSAYACNVSYIDDCFEEIISKLKKDGLYDESIIVFMTDHGTTLGSHGWLYKGHPYMIDELSRIPFMVKFPHNKHRGDFKGVSSTVDILPTLLSNLGMKHNNCDGKDLFSFNEETGKNHAVFGQHGYGTSPEAISVRMIRKGKWKYNLYNLPNTEELYDLENDPQEMNNLASKEPKVKDGLYKELCAYITNSSDPFLIP